MKKKDESTRRFYDMAPFLATMVIKNELGMKNAIDAYNYP